MNNQEIPIVHLTTDRAIKRDQTDGRAFCLNETGLPFSDGTPEAAHRIIKFLDVEKSRRYQRTASQTFCNIYAYDYAYLMGAFLPRVWWVPGAIQLKTFTPRYGKTVTEMTANALYDWFVTYGDNYGWKPVDMDQAQHLANAGKCVIMVAANKSASRSGHIVAVVPEKDRYIALRAAGMMLAPLMSQAGMTNHDYFSRNWWASGHKPVRIYAHLD